MITDDLWALSEFRLVATAQLLLIRFGSTVLMNVKTRKFIKHVGSVFGFEWRKAPNSRSCVSNAPKLINFGICQRVLWHLHWQAHRVEALSSLANGVLNRILTCQLSVAYETVAALRQNAQSRTTWYTTYFMLVKRCRPNKHTCTTASSQVAAAAKKLSCECRWFVHSRDYKYGYLENFAPDHTCFCGAVPLLSIRTRLWFRISLRFRSAFGHLIIWFIDK